MWKERTHTDTHSSHHHLHSRFLKSSHISVTMATLLRLPLFFVPAFFFLKKKKSITPSLFCSLSPVNITETPRLTPSFGASRGRGPRRRHISEGVVKEAGWGQYQEGMGDRGPRSQTSSNSNVQV